MYSPLLQRGLDIVYISDLDILAQGVADHFFDVEIWNVQQDWPNTRLIFQIEDEESIISTAESDPFTLPRPATQPVGGPAYRASNVDLLNAHTIPGTGIFIDFSRRSLHLPDSHFQDYVLRTGQLRRGIYLLKVFLENPAWGAETVAAQLRIVVTNPSLIFLKSPQDREIVRTEFPLFQFESDAREFEVSVYKRIGEDDDVETILAGHPALQWTTNLKQFSYQMTGGEPLEPGATYFWRVNALVQTTHGLEAFSSPVYRFTVDTEAGLGQQMDIARILEPLLGEQARQIADQLAGYDLKSIRFNGEVLTLQEFFQMMTDLGQGEFEIRELSLE